MKGLIVGSHGWIWTNDFTLSKGTKAYF